VQALVETAVALELRCFTFGVSRHFPPIRAPLTYSLCSLSAHRAITMRRPMPYRSRTSWTRPTRNCALATKWYVWDPHVCACVCSPQVRRNDSPDRMR
jgi:hypothetical protein